MTKPEFLYTVVSMGGGRESRLPSPHCIYRAKAGILVCAGFLTREGYGVMIPTNVLTNAMMAALGSDTTMLAGALWLWPIKSDFTPGDDPGLLDTDRWTTDGGGSKTTGAATRDVLIDPASGQLFIRIPDPAGGWQWTTTADIDPAVTIYGFALGNDSATIEGGALLATALQSPPVVLNSDGQSFGYGDVTFTLVMPALQ